MSIVPFVTLHARYDLKRYDEIARIQVCTIALTTQPIKETRPTGLLIRGNDCYMCWLPYCGTR